MDNVPTGWDKEQNRRQASFLQSGYWGAFQAKIGIKPHYLTGKGWSCLLLEKHNRLGRYLFSQYGPAVDSRQGLETALSHIKDYGRRSGAGWLSLEPVSVRLPADEIRQIVRRNGGRPAARHREPDLTRVIDLSPDPDDLLASISQSTRSFIRKNQREKFIAFKTSTDPGDIRIFINMLEIVARRENISFYADSYFEKQAQLLIPAGVMHLELALSDKKPVAAAVFHDYGQVANYTYAASLPEARKTSASALLLWQAMLNAKARGMTKMDLYGIAPDEAPDSHPWAGFTAFKAKFGGEIVQLAGTWDISLSPRYSLYRSAHRARKIIRRH